MVTTDSNGLVQFQTSDKVEPLQTTLNLISSSVSNVLNGIVRSHNVKTITERNALATANPPTAAKPLLAWVQNNAKFYLNSGGGWFEWPEPMLEIDIPEIPEVKIPIVQYAGSKSFGLVAKNGGTTEVDVSFGVTLSGTSGWIPLISLRGAHGSVDRLTATITSYTTTGIKVRVKNITAKNTTGTHYLNWSLQKKRP